MNLGRLASVQTRITRYGWRRTAEYAISGLIEWWLEKRYGIETAAPVELAQVGIFDRRLREYRALDYWTLHKIFRKLSIRPSSEVLVDFGAGKGRVLTVAATYPLKSVVGVELVERFCSIARKNIESAKRRFRCDDVRIVCSDATIFDIPPDASIFFFYNPFGGEVLGRVFDNIRSSVLRHPRAHHIVYVRPKGAGSGWVGEQPWLRRTDHFIGLQGVEVYFFQTSVGESGPYNTDVQ
ncbi:MAG TPA: class I SAM-dependent methyltransferase [Syntrophobacter fumaroxidans]|nr:class I SAM-dependent methyltransferase [Syntrophobacter fumaroxidans]